LEKQERAVVKVLERVFKKWPPSLPRWVGHSMHHSHRSPQGIRHWLQQVLPERGHKRFLDFLPWAILGVVLSTSCHLNKIAVALPEAGLPKIVLQRLWRWLSRPSFRVIELLPLMARPVLARQSEEWLVLSIDRTEWKYANLLYAAVSYRGRALPIGMLLLSGPKATNAEELRQLLAQVAPAVPPEAEVVVVGDREFGNIPAIRVIRSHGWHFVLRFKQDTWLWAPDGSQWRAKDQFPSRGQKALWSGLQVTGHRYGPLQVAIIWATQEPEPWILVSDLPAPTMRRCYRRRMRIEEMFSDFKKRGFNLEATRLRQAERLLRLVGLLSLTYLWLLLAATVIMRRGWRRLVDTACRRALSYLQIALRFLRYQPPERVLALSQAVTQAYAPK
jgi:hypothetical protein